MSGVLSEVFSLFVLFLFGRMLLWPLFRLSPYRHYRAMRKAMKRRPAAKPAAKRPAKKTTSKS